MGDKEKEKSQLSEEPGSRSHRFKYVLQTNSKDPKESHHKDDNDTRDAEHGSISPLARQSRYLVDKTGRSQYSSHRIRNMSESLISPRTVGYGVHMTASLIKGLTSTNENKNEGETSVEDHENN